MCPIGQKPIVNCEQKDSSSLIPALRCYFIVVVYVETKTQDSKFSKTFSTKSCFNMLAIDTQWILSIIHCWVRDAQNLHSLSPGVLLKAQEGDDKEWAKEWDVDNAWVEAGLLDER